MVKLKTLKDIQEDGIIHMETEGEDNTLIKKTIQVSQLRQEAIKRIKEHDWIFDVEKDDWYDIPEELHLTHVDKEFQLICLWIKHFFNITEDDLK